MNKKIRSFFTLFPITFWFLMVIALPLAYIVFLSFTAKPSASSETGQITFTLDNYARMGKPVYLRVFWDSLVLAVETTAITLILGYPLAYFISNMGKRSRLMGMLMIIMPFWTNSLVRIYGWVILLTPIGMIHSYPAVLIGMVYALFPFMVLPLYTSIESMDRTRIEAAKDLGANPFQAFLKITVPQTAPGICAGAILVFVPSVGLFFITDILGGAKGIFLGNLIKNQFSVSNNMPFGSALSVVMTLMSLIFVMVYLKFIKNKAKIL